MDLNHGASLGEGLFTKLATVEMVNLDKQLLFLPIYIKSTWLWKMFSNLIYMFLATRWVKCKFILHTRAGLSFIN